MSEQEACRWLWAGQGASVLCPGSVTLGFTLPSLSLFWNVRTIITGLLGKFMVTAQRLTHGKRSIEANHISGLGIP